MRPAITSSVARNALDHLVYGVPDLHSGVRRFQNLTGLEPVFGGRHERQGTANYLVGLGELSYLEIIGPDPDSDQPLGWFALDQLVQPRLLTWAVRTVDIDASVAAAQVAGYDPGSPAAMSRRTSAGDSLTWRLTPDTVESTGGTVPFLIDWGDSRHPATGLEPQLRLESLTVLTPAADTVGASLAALGIDAGTEFATGAGLRCAVSGPGGEVILA
jgi:hypothetical protein